MTVAETQEQNDEIVFQDAVNALRRGDKPRAKELLTLLLKSDQNNPTYWIWLSASVDSPKERVYCLQTALKLDPDNSTAKRGLILLGALAPDETIQPFPMNRPRVWEQKLLLAHEKPKEKGVKVAMRSPIVRLSGLAVVGIGLCLAIYFGFILPSRGTAEVEPTNTPGPSPTFTATPTFFGATAVPTQVFDQLAPLESLLNLTYTPTPLYVNTPRDQSSVDQFRIALDAYQAKDWDAFIENMRLIQRVEPNAPDIPYYIGEAYRFKGDTGNAARSYREAIAIDDNFAPPYLGLARVSLMSNPGFNAEKYFEQAIERDPNLGEAYLERARWLIGRGDIEDAFPDLEIAEKILPGSPEVYLAYARAYEAQGDQEKALEYAQKAYAADVLNVSTYKMLGELYIAGGEYAKAAEALRVYTAYETGDASGFGKLGLCYYRLGEYENAVTAVNGGVEANPRGMRKYLVYRALSLVELGRGNEALEDFEVAVDEDPDSFIIRLGYARAFYADGKFGSAFLQIEAAGSFVETDEERALELYWRAKIQEKREEINDAIKAWKDLLKLDEDAMTPEMRAEAESRLKDLVPPTDTPTPTRTPRGGGSTSTPTPASSTQNPAATPTTPSAPTQAPTRTPTPTP